MTYLINSGQVMYWGTARWSPFEIFEAYASAKSLGAFGPICEMGEYHCFHREKVELYMAELYNKIGEKRVDTVSYTHLTLPTILRV